MVNENGNTCFFHSFSFFSFFQVLRAAVHRVDGRGSSAEAGDGKVERVGRAEEVPRRVQRLARLAHDGADQRTIIKHKAGAWDPGIV